MLRTMELILGLPSVDVARLHEIGISVAHSGYHKHSAYILANADMPGFSRMEQQRLARIVLAHRGKLGKMQDAGLEGADHDRDPRNIRLTLQQVKKSDHGFFSIQQCIVHVHIQYLRAIFHLLPGRNLRALLADLRFDHIDFVADVDAIGHGFFMAVIADHVFLEEAVCAVVRGGGEAEQAEVGRLEEDLGAPPNYRLRNERVLNEILTKQPGDIVRDLGSEMARTEPIPPVYPHDDD